MMNHILTYTILLLAFLPIGRCQGKGKKQVCRGKDKTIFKEGESYTEGCVTYTCTRLAKKMMTMVPSVIGKCCEVKARGLYKVGEVIEVADTGSCSRKTVKCEITPHDRPQVTTTIDHGNCCLYKGEPNPVGAKFPFPEKCSWLVCKYNGEQDDSPSLDLEVEHDDCHCCMGEGGRMFRDGDKMISSNGVEVSCYKGNWVNTVKVEDEMTAAQDFDDVVVIENDSLLKQIMKWNSSESLLTLVEDEKEKDESTEILFYINSNVRVIKDSTKCLVTKMAESMNPGKMIGNFKYFSKTESDRSQTNYMITVETGQEHEIVTSAGIETACQGRKIMMAEDVSVTKELYEMLHNGHMITMSEPHARTEPKSMECDGIANIAEPTHSWQNYHYNPNTETGTISKHLAMKTQDPGCCSRNELGSLHPCPCKQLAQFSLLQKCGSWHLSAVEKCRINLKHPTITLFLELGGRIIIQERDCQ